MPNTGIFFMNAFSQVCIFLPLLPVIIILLKKGYQDYVLVLLLFLCLLNFIKNFLLFVPDLPISTQYSITHLFALVELIFLFIIFWSSIPDNLKYLLLGLLTIFLSSLITYVLIIGFNTKIPFLEAFEAGFILLIAIIGLNQLLDKEDLSISQSPQAWIATGSIFYFAIFLLLHIVNAGLHGGPNEQDRDTRLILDISELVRYLLFVIAGYQYRSIKKGIEEAGS